jgi:superfamily II RNA helicase
MEHSDIDTSGTEFFSGSDLFSKSDILKTDEALSILFRDLAIGEDLNVRSLYEDHKKSLEVKPIEEKKGSGSKKKESGKKDKIKASNISIKANELIEEDLTLLSQYEKLGEVTTEVLDEIKLFKTSYGRERMKMHLLNIAYQNKQYEMMVNLYLQILGARAHETPFEKELRENAKSYADDEKTMSRMHKQLMGMDYKTIQFRDLADQLSPLDFYNRTKKTLEPWQIDVMTRIENRQSTIVCAPTSSGKTWFGQLSGLLGQETLFIVPTKPLVYQVASVFNKFGVTVSIITDDLIKYNPKSTVVIGTPKDIEDNLLIACQETRIVKNGRGIYEEQQVTKKYKIEKSQFKFCVYDEIHNLDNVYGDAYERVIKLFSGIPFLALSATINNSDKLQSWFEKVTGQEVGLIKYTTRFLNLQRHLFDSGKLKKIHPLECLTIDDINETFLKTNFPMTPYDSVSIFEELTNFFPKERIKHLKPELVFPEANQRLSLEDARIYEGIIKSELVKLKEEYPEITAQLLEKYKPSEDKPTEIPEDKRLMIEENSIYNMFREIKRSDMTPAIVFHMNTENCLNLYKNMIKKLEKLEIVNYPYHYENQKFLSDFYKGHLAHIIEYKSSFSKDKKKKTEESKEGVEVSEYDKKTSMKKLDRVDRGDELEKAIEREEAKQLNRLKEEMTSRMKTQLETIANSEANEKVKQVQMNNLKKDYNEWFKSPCIGFVDEWAKHADFVLNSRNPMGGDAIRQIRRQLRSEGLEIEYTNIYLQGLKRGIGIYCRDLPSAYNRMVQTLAQNGQLGFVISDETLALGINMPFRSCVILGYNDNTEFTRLIYEQMIGRAGRRGKDVEGHIVYYNVDWKRLMKGELANINGRFEYLPNYPVIETIINGPLKEDPSYFSVEPVLKDYLNEKTTEQLYNRFKYDEKKKVELWLTWKLRYYKNSVTNFFKQLNNLTILHKETRDSAKNIILPLISLCFIEQQELRTLTGFVKEDIKLTSEISPSGFTMELMEGIRNNKLEFSNYENYRKYLEVMGIMKEIVNGISLIKVEGGFQGEWLKERLGKLYKEMEYLLQKYSEFN